MKNESEIKTEIQKLLNRNAEITKGGGFFTDEQLKNESLIRELRMILRFEFGDDA